MTTLPQNPTMQLPRPMAAMPQTAAPNSGGMTGADILRVLRSNAWLIIAMAVVSGLIGYLLNSYLAKNYSRYTAAGFLAVELPQSATLQNRGGLSDSALSIEQRTQVQQLKSEALIKSVLLDPESPIRETSWFKSIPDIRDQRADLAKNLSVGPVPETRLIQVAMTYSVPTDARIVVEAVVEKYLHEQVAATRDREFDLRSRYQQRRENVDAGLRQAEIARAAAQQDLANSGVSAEGGLRINLFDTQVDAAAKDLLDAQSRADGLRSALEGFNKQVATGQEPPEVARAVESDPQFVSMQGLVREAELNIDELKRRGYGTDSKERKIAEGRVQEMTANREAKRAELATKYRLSFQQELQTKNDAAKSALELAKENLEKLKAQQGGLQRRFNDFRAAADQEEAYQRQRQQIQTEIDEVNNGGSAPAMVRWATKPIDPDVPSFPKLSATMTAALTVGLALALAIAFAKELMDQTIRSPRDVVRLGNIPVLGTIPHDDDDPQAAGARLAIAEAPASMTAENLRQLRTRLQHQGNLDTTRSLLITSPNPGDGKTTVAANLAAGLALAGRKILLVDANFRRPELHKLFGLEDKDGFAVALTSPENLATLAKSTKVPNLSVLPAGQKPANATELLESPLLSGFIDKALESYDHVIFDSGPLLFASETVSMAPRVDGVVTVVKARASTRGVLARVKDNLRQIKANSLGVVINGIRAYGGGYYSRNIRTYYEYSNSK